MIADLVAKHKRVFRVDSEFRSLERFHRAVELVRNGRIGTAAHDPRGIAGGGVPGGAGDGDTRAA